METNPHPYGPVLGGLAAGLILGALGGYYWAQSMTQSPEPQVEQSDTAAVDPYENLEANPYADIRVNPFE